MLMLSDHTTRSVFLREIDLEDAAFRMSYLFDINGLVESIRKVGLINSPILLKTGQGRFIVVTGYRRILAVRSLGWESVFCVICDEDKISREKCLESGIHENLFTRQFNDVEKGMVLARLAVNHDMDFIIKEFMPLLDMPANQKTVDTYMAIENDLTGEFKKNISQGRLSMPTVTRLLKMSMEDRDCVFQFFSKLRMNMNQQKQFIAFIEDISISEKIGLQDVLTGKDLQEIIRDPNLNDPQKSNAVLRNLKIRIFPKLTSAEESFKQMVKDLKLPHGVTVSNPAFFESPYFSMEIQFKDGGDLQDKIQLLASGGNLKNLKKPWDREK